MFDSTRRRLLGLTAFAVGAVALRAGAAAPSPVVSPSVALSRLLTGWQGLDARVVSRAFAALADTTPHFEERAHALWAAITRAGLQSVEEFRGSPLYQDQDQRATAAMLVSAFYLGVVGDGETARLVSYEGALMFAPTQEVTPIPSYALGGPGYWASP